MDRSHFVSTLLGGCPKRASIWTVGKRRTWRKNAFRKGRQLRFKDPKRTLCISGKYARSFSLFQSHSMKFKVWDSVTLTTMYILSTLPWQLRGSPHYIVASCEVNNRLKTIIDSNFFQIFVNNKPFCTFAHRSDPNGISKLQIEGDVVVAGIQIIWSYDSSGKSRRRLFTFVYSFFAVDHQQFSAHQSISCEYSRRSSEN